MTDDISDNQHWSERYRVAGKEWVTLESAASMLEECRGAMMAQWMVKQGDIPVAHAERIVKASPEWMDFITKMVKAREAANLAQVKLAYIKMKAWEETNDNANARAERRL